MAEIAARCAACDGYGWVEEDADDLMDLMDLMEPAANSAGGECTWCGGIGYVLQDQRGVSRRIPVDQLAAYSEILERLELERLREIGYSGEAKKPWQQQIRLERGDRIARPPGRDDPPGGQ